MEIEGAGINVGKFFLYVEVVNQSLLLVSMCTPRNGTLFVDIDFLCKIKNRIILKGLSLYIYIYIYRERERERALLI